MEINGLNTNVYAGHVLPPGQANGGGPSYSFSLSLGLTVAW